MKKSKLCGNSNSCVHVGATEAGLIRVGKDPKTGPFHVYTRAEWDVFVAGVKAGEFDTDVLILEAARERA